MQLDRDVLSKWADRALCAIFPRRCVYCGAVIRPERTVCNRCVEELPRIVPPICLLCGHEKADCTCKHKKQKYKAICAPFYYEDTIVKAVHRYKFEDRDFLAEPYARNMAAAVRREFSDIAFDTVTFVPFTKEQARTRAFNPSELLARHTAKESKLPCETLLQKLYETEPQHSLKSSARSGNVLGVYDVAPNVSVEGKTVLLVDDIKTTGATLSECSKMLLLGGAEAVYCCTFAVTRHKKQETHTD